MGIYLVHSPTNHYNHIHFVTESQLKSKWKTLCTTFQKELNKLPKLPSGSAAIINVKSNWVHFESMKFLSNKANQETSGSIVDFARDNNGNGKQVIKDSSSAIPESSDSSKSSTKSILEACTLDEADKLYLASLMPYVKSIKDPRLKLEFRTEANLMIHNFMYNRKSKSSLKQTEEQEERDEGIIFSSLIV